MKKILIGLRSLAILLGVWLLLALVALVAGVFPSVELGGAAGSSASTDAADAGLGDAGVVDVDAGADAGAMAESDAALTLGADGAVATRADASATGADAGTAAAAGSPREAGPALRVRVCASDVFEPVLVAADVLRSGGSELLIGCGDSFSLLSVEPAHAGARVSRVARFRLAQGPPGTEARARDVAAGDIDMDGRVDLLFGFVWLRPGRGGPQGGALDWVGRSPNSGFTPGHRLAPIAATRVALTELDGTPGADPVALNATDPHGRRLSEVWVFSGGASPQRLAKPSVGRGGLDFALLDLDGDDHLDLAALSYEAPRLTLFFGDGAAHFEGLTALSVAGGTRLTVGLRRRQDSGTQPRDLVASGGSFAVVEAGAREALAASPLSFTEPERASHVVGLSRVESDGDLGLVGIAGHDLVGLELAAAGEPASLRVLRSFPPSFMPLAFVTAELDGLRGVDLAALGRGTASDAPLELVIISDFLFDAPGARDASGAMPAVTIPLSPTLAPLKDAPLSLQVALP